MHWRKMMSSDKLYAADLEGREWTVTIARVAIGEYPDMEDSRKKLTKPDLYFKGGKKPLGLNSTNARAISKLLGSSDTDDWIGRTIVMYPTTTNAFGEEHECIRIKNRLPKEDAGPKRRGKSEPQQAAPTAPPVDDEEARAIAEQEAMEAGR